MARRPRNQPGDSTPVTPFQKKLFDACKRIPRGKVTTYGFMAKVLGSSARGVGQGMRRNPFAPIVPCHRVIASGGCLGGFSGAWGDDCEELRRKRRMLEGEGVRFMSQGKVVPECITTVEELTELLKKKAE